MRHRDRSASSRKSLPGGGGGDGAVTTVSFGGVVGIWRVELTLDDTGGTGETALGWGVDDVTFSVGCPDPVLCGQWEGPDSLTIPCPSNDEQDCFLSCPSFPRCASADEIEHATLIPAGVHQGRLLVWTRCQIPALRNHPSPPHPEDCSTQSDYPYRSHIVDPVTSTVVDSPWFQPGYNQALQTSPAPDLQAGPGCSGHTWMLDQNEKPKFLVAGGSDFITSYSSKHTLWFDPFSTTSLPSPFGTQYWLDGPGLLPDLDTETPNRGTWYPSVITYLNPSLNRYLPMVVGGARIPRGFTQVNLYEDWWRMQDLASLAWLANPTTSDPDYTWHHYPRLLFLHTDDHTGEVFQLGSKKAWAEENDPDHPDPNQVHYPAQTIHTHTATHTHSYHPRQPSSVDSWNYSNVVLLHTLKPGWQFPGDPADVAAVLAEYDLNRVIGMLGTLSNKENDRLNEPGPGPEEAINVVRERISGPLFWKDKQSALRARAYSNAVLLPDATILVLGGESHLGPGGAHSAGAPIPGFTYYYSADVFDPDTPSSDGSWTELASTNLVSPPNSRTPRGHHSMALLLPSGRVALIGGQNNVWPDNTHGDFPPAADTVEYFRPPYFFKGQRPSLSLVPTVIHYGDQFSVRATHTIARFCLIGTSTVTHHHNYGQRFVDLLFKSLPPPPPSSPPGFSPPTHELLLPNVADLVPEGYYLLFAVDAQGRPSKGKFVKVVF